MPSFIDTILKEEEPSEKLEMQHKRDQTTICNRNVYKKTFQSFVQCMNVQANVAQVGFGNRI